MSREQIFLRGDTDFTLKDQWPFLSLKSLHSIWWASGRTRDSVGAFFSLSEGNATASMVSLSWICSFPLFCDHKY